jgi:hypothetical protein
MALGGRPARWRGRRWLLLGAVATAVVLAINAAMSARSPVPARQLAEQSYVDQVIPIVQASTQQGQDIDTVRTQALTLTAAVITGRLAQVASDAQTTLTTAERVGPPKQVQTANDLLVATLAIRVESAQALQRAMTAALSGEDTQSAVSSLVAVGQDLTAADRTYELFVKAASFLGDSLPASTWVADSTAYTEPNLTVLLATLRSATTLTPVHDTAVVLVTTDPAPVSLNGTTQVLPISTLLNLQIVVADVGNQPERNLTVSATISPSVIGPTQMVRDFVDLTPGQRRTVDLGGLRVQPGQPTTLTVNIETVPGEANTANNTKVVPLMMH